MKTIILIIPIFFTSLAHAKCWSAEQMAPVFCGEIKTTQEPQDCLAEGKIISMKIPFAEDQNTSFLEGLKGKKVVVMIPKAACEQIHKGSNLKGAFSGYCNDNSDGQGRQIDVTYMGKGPIQVERHGKTETLNCTKP